MRQLDEAESARLVLVSAPAGFGKTTVLADWLTQSQIASTWLSLDASDNEPSRFMRYLEAAVRSIGTTPASGESGPAEANQDGPQDPALVLGRVLDMLDVPGRTVVVLDDYHVIDEPAVHSAVGFLLDHLPRTACLVIATRANPPLPLAKLRVRGELLELRAADLRFTNDEAAELLQRRTGGALAPDQVATLTDRTEGWAAALQLAALSLRGRPDIDALVDRFGASNRFVLDFVVEEVLGRLPDDLEEFLLRTSILERLSGELCDAVAGTSDGRERLQRIEEANLLVVPLDEERHWYRYHALFAEILRARQAVADSSLVPVLHSRAAAWFEAHGSIDEAVLHAARGSDLSRAGRLFRANWLALVHSGEFRTVRRWLDAFPDDMVRTDPQLSAAYAWMNILMGQRAGMRERIEDADRALESGGTGDPIDRLVVPSQLASLRSRFAQLEGDLPEAVARAREAVELVPDSLPLTDRALLRGDARLMLAHALRISGDSAAAEIEYKMAVPLLRQGGNWIAAGHALSYLARMRIAMGQAQAAVDLCKAGLSDPAGSPEAALLSVRVALAEALAAVGSLDEAEAEATSAVDGARARGQGVTFREAQSLLEAIRNRRSAAVAADSHLRRAVDALTVRELEVLRLVALGRSNRQVAAELFVSLSTAKTHMHAICAKLGAANRVEAIVRGRELNLVP